MTNYKDSEKQVFDWLLAKHKKDSNFTFSLRQKANKGAELNYFIGTEKSNYFSTTFWFVPVAYPGSSSDLINLVFKISNNEFTYNIQFNQTKTPQDNQNSLALQLIRNIKPNLSGFGERFYSNLHENKMEYFQVASLKRFKDLKDLLSDLETDLETIIPIVNQEIEKLKKVEPTFIAHPFSEIEQKKMLDKMEIRFKNHENTGNQIKLLDDTEEEVIQIQKSNNNFPLNQILYGPPGTGKTYNSINKAISIINPSFDFSQEREIIKTEFDRLVNEGQIVFTTFHQSMSYEDFIEGIKPKIDEDDNENKQVIYEIEDGIFKQLVNNAKKVKTASKQVVESYSFDDAWDDLVNDAERNLESNKPLVLSIQTPNLGLKIVEISERGNLKLKPIYSEEAKEYTISYLRAKKLQEVFPDLSLIKNIDKEFRAVIGGSNSTAYWSILNYINQKININSKVVKQEKELPALPHVLIIDEINRGNVSQIFGELITLIEDSKRLGEVEALEVTLSYSKKKFGIPSNVYIIGTMNTADRSVEALDTALRRRFSFVEMMPELEVVEKENFKDFDRVSIMKKINHRVEVLLDRNYTLGHSYFIKEDFKNSFKNEIMPLLQEYFYNDYGKIGLVLGKGFVREKAITAKNDKTIFADFDTKNEVDIIKSYELIPFNDEEFDFNTALETLLA
jgi:hypothetical protein